MIYTKSKFHRCMFLTLFFVMHCSKPTYATTDAVWSGEFVLRVDGADHTLWGYSTDMAIHYFCLFDMAYLLNGTPAQFNIRKSSSGQWDFWIVRGEAFEMSEQAFAHIQLFREIPPRFATRSEGFGLFGWENNGFLHYPEQTVVMGIDGEETPQTSLAIRTITDKDNVYFMLSELADILGFEHVITTSRWHPGDWHDDFVPGIDRTIDTSHTIFPVLREQSPELTRLLIELSGHWVAATFFDSDYIDETVVWPVEIAFNYQGMYRVILDTLSPIRPEWTLEAWENRWQSLSPVHESHLPNGVVELTPMRQDEFPEYRVVVPSQPERIDEITLYIADVPHLLKRHDDIWADVSRYTVQAMQGDSVLLRHIPRRWVFTDDEEADIRVYRITAGQRELLHGQIGVSADDRILFEFIDPNPIPGAVHYYEIMRVRRNWTYLATDPIRVDVYELLGLPGEEVVTAEKSLVNGGITTVNDHFEQGCGVNEGINADERSVNYSRITLGAIAIIAFVTGAKVFTMKK